MFKRNLVIACVLLCSLHARADDSDTAATAAEAALDSYIAAFNARDPAGWAATLHFPYISFADGQVVTYANRDAAIAALDFETFAETTGWRRSAVVSHQVVQAQADKVHLAARLARYNSADEAFAVFDGLFIIERLAGRWGVRAYSRFAFER